MGLGLFGLVGFGLSKERLTYNAKSFLGYIIGPNICTEPETSAPSYPFLSRKVVTVFWFVCLEIFYRLKFLPTFIFYRPKFLPTTRIKFYMRMCKFSCLFMNFCNNMQTCWLKSLIFQILSR